MVVVSLYRLSSSAVKQCWLFPPLSSQSSSSALTTTFCCLSCTYYGCFIFRQEMVFAEHDLGYCATSVALASEVDLWKAPFLRFCMMDHYMAAPWSNTCFDYRVRCLRNVHQGASHDWGRSCHHHCLQADHYTGAEGGSRLKNFLMTWMII